MKKKFVIKILLSALFAILFFYSFNKIGWPSAEQWSNIVSLEMVLPIIIFIVFGLIAQVLRGYRWRLLINYDDRPMLIPYIVHGWCFLLGIVTPLKAGEAGKIYWSKRLENSYKKGLIALILERIYDLSILLIIGFTAATFITELGVGQLKTKILMLIAVILVLAFVCALWFVINNKKINIYLEKKLPKKIGDTYIDIRKLLGEYSKSRLLVVAVTTCAIWMLLGYGYSIILKQYYPALPSWIGIFVIISVNLTGMLGLTPVNAGVFEASAMGVLLLWGINATDSLPKVTGIHLLIFITFSIYGIICRIILATPQYKKKLEKKA